MDYNEAKEVQKERFVDNGQPYLHTTNAGFAQGFKQTPLSKAQDIRDEYARQAKEFKSTAAKNLGMSEEEAGDLLLQFKALADSQRASDRIQKAQKDVAENLKQGVKTTGNLNVYQISSNQEARKALLDDSEQLNKFLEDLEKAAKQYTRIPKSLIEKIEEEARITSPTSSKWKGKFQEGEIFKSSKKAENSMKRLLGSIERLKQIKAGKTASLGQIMVGSGSVDSRIKMSEEEALLRLLSGLVTNVTGSGFEVGYNAAMKVGKNYPKKIIKEIVDRSGGKIIYSKSGAAGEGKADIENAEELDLTKNYAVNKGDVNYNLRVKEDGVSVDINIGLSLKDIEAGKDKPVSIMGGANLYDFLARSQQLQHNNDLYIMMNGFINRKKRAGSKNVYDYGAAGTGHNASAYSIARRMIAAKGALIAFAGAGTRKDTAYFIVYRNKVIGLEELFLKISTGAAKEPNLTIETPGNASSIVAGYAGLDPVKRYAQAKNAIYSILRASTTNITQKS